MSQIFRNIYPKNKLITYIKKISVFKNKYYLFTINLFKKLKYNNGIKPFIEDIKPYYKPSKQFYVERNMNFKHFITVIRQLCKIHNVKYENRIKYLHNRYDIDYYFYIDQNVNKNKLSE
mgnify:CR=1 FL=1